MEGNTVLRWVRALTLASVLLGSASRQARGRGRVRPDRRGAASPVRPGRGRPGAPPERPGFDPSVTALLVVGAGRAPRLLQVLGGSTAARGRRTLDRGARDSRGRPPLHAPGARCRLDADRLSSLVLVTEDHLALLLAHVAAALAVGSWLAAGERAAWRLVSLAALPVVDAWITLRELATSAAVALVAATRPGCRPGASERDQVVVLGRPGGLRRGPPRLIAA